MTNFEYPPEHIPPLVEDHANVVADRDRLTAILHGMCRHPDYEYATTESGRKAGGYFQPEGDGWELNTAKGEDGSLKLNPMEVMKQAHRAYSELRPDLVTES